MLALVHWETKSLDKKLLERVKAIIESEQDLQVWRELEAPESQTKKRKIALEKFLEKISLKKTKPKARKKKRTKEPIFDKRTCLTFKLDNDNYSGAVVIEADRKEGYGYNLIVSTSNNQLSKPT